MSHWETVHTEEHEGFTITLRIAPAYDEPDWDVSPEELKEINDKIESGALLWFVARVSASKAGVELGDDYLGGNCYASAQEFVGSCVYDDMREAAIEAAKAKITELTQA